MVLSVIVAIIACSTLQTVEPEAARDAFDRDAFQRLAQQDRLAYTLEAVQWREDQLQNFTYDLTERMTQVIDDTPADEPFAVHDVALKRLGSRNLLHRRTLREGKVVLEVWSGWDGQTRRERHRRPERPFFTGTIGDAESNAVGMTFYNEVLGYRVYTIMEDGRGGYLTLPEWLEHNLHFLKCRPELDLEGEDGAELITLRLRSEPGGLYQMWFDPRRDFMLVQEADTRSFADDASIRRTDVTDATKIDGIWVPVKVVQTRQVSREVPPTKYECEVSHFGRGVVDDEDLRIHYPPGSIVLDRTKREAFRVDDDGTWVPTPLAEQPRPE